MKNYGMKNFGEEALEFIFEWIQIVKICVLHDNTHKQHSSWERR